MSVQAPTPEQVWQRVEARLDRDPRAGLNTAHECCERWAGDRGRLALVVRHPDGRRETWTYHELARAAARAARVFASLGLRPGDRVAAVLSRQVEAWIAAFAAWRSGLVYVPLFVGFGAQALAQRLASAEPGAVVVSHAVRATLEAAQELGGGDFAVLTVADGRGNGPRAGDRSLWAELDRAAPDGPTSPTHASDTATLVFTSGTTSEPKACQIPHSGFLSLVPFTEHVQAVDLGDLMFSTTDPGWSYGLYTTGCVPMSLGVPRVIYSGDFDPLAWLDVIAAEDVTHVASAPTAFRKLIGPAAEHGTAPSLRAATSAGEALEPETVEAWNAATHAPIRDGYGLTELGMVLANLGDPAQDVVPGALGGPVPGFEVDLLDQDGDPIEGEGEGMIAVRRPRWQLSSGYANAPEQWDARWSDGRFLTEDVAYRDASGSWWFRGRQDDVIVTAGYNVGPAEVESALVEHEAVLEAAVIGVPDPERGAAIHASVVCEDGAAHNEALIRDLQDLVRRRIGRHAYPREVRFIAALPRTETGKVKRGELRREVAAAHALEAQA